MSQYHNDQPISGSEIDPDRLNRDSFSKNLAEMLVLKPNEDCLTVSLEGEWGYGKTSVINLVKSHCSQLEKKPVIIEYNPWLAGKAEVMIQDFLVQVSSQLNIPDRPKEGLKAAKELLSYSNLFSAMKFIPGVEPWASTVQGVFKAVGGATKKISKLKELDLLGRKEKVKAVLGELNISIIIIIDDIDRLTPDEAFQVVRLTKAVADFPGTSFLLAFDPEYLASALARHGIEKSDQYIDKVVQLRVPLPLIAQKDMQQLTNIEFEKLSEASLTDKFEKDQDRLSVLFHRRVKYVIRTPRELKRLFNHLRFVLKQTEGEVSFTDLYALSVLVIKAPNVYQHIKESPISYVGRNFDETIYIEKESEVVKINEEERSKALVGLPDKDRKHIGEIVEDLFPLTKDSSAGSRDYDKQGRVASPKRLYIALHYQIPTGYAADKDVVAFILNEVDRLEYLRRAIPEGFVERFLELLSMNTEKISEENIEGVLKSIYDVFLPSEYIKQSAEEAFGLFVFDPFSFIRAITFELIDKSEKKYSLISNLVDDKNYALITADIMRKMFIQFEKEAAPDQINAGSAWLDEKDFNELREKWITQTVELIESGEISDSQLVGGVYFTLRHVDIKSVNALLLRLLEKESGIVKIAKLIGRCGKSSSHGGYAHIEKKDFDDEMVYSNLKKAAQKELDREGDMDPFLQAVYKSIVTGDKYYHSDPSEPDNF